jgi:hypothetical protein
MAHSNSNNQTGVGPSHHIVIIVQNTYKQSISTLRSPFLRPKKESGIVGIQE